MTQNESMASELLAMSASAYAAYASNRLLEKCPELGQQFGDSTFRHWKDHFQHRVNELSVALAENEPKLFSSRVRWTQEAFQARDVPIHVLHDSLVCLQETLAEELPESCRQAPQPYFAAALDSITETAESPAPTAVDDRIDHLASRYLVNILEGNSQDAISLIVDAFQDGLGFNDAYAVLLTAQTKTGQMWHHAEISIAEEHYVSSTTIRAMSILVYLAEKKPANGMTVVAAAVAQNAHDIGVRAVSDFFEVAGWRAICLGDDAPPTEIAQAVDCFGASLVLLSAALSTQLKAVRTTIQEIKSVSHDCMVLVGGSAFSDTEEIWRQLGADGFSSSPTDAVATGTRLVAPQQP